MNSDSESDASDLVNELDAASEGTLDDRTDAVCLFCPRLFSSAAQVFAHAAQDHGFDFACIARDLRLDFFGRIKLVNYVRAEVASGRQLDVAAIAVSRDKFLQGDEFMKPVLEDDAVLFDLEDDDDENDSRGSGDIELRRQLDALRLEFDQYKDMVKSVIGANVKDVVDDNDDSDDDASSVLSAKSVVDNDSHYFESYSYNDIHETMLKDTIRTDAYRDFVYQNKDVFAGKTVLDVGCGTGVLSMFAARAGAAKVIAVDNSDIIHRAIANVHENGLADVIECVRGKIEDVVLPVQQVDIIVSEWMGYALLYEAMLDSVLTARDKYLAPGGLLIPSEIRLLAAPLRAGSEYVNDKVHFWNDVYGFKMTAMKANIYDDVLIDSLTPESLAGPPVTFKSFPLHSVTIADLDFSAPFSLPLHDAAATNNNAVDGILVYFDSFFTRSATESVPENARAESFNPGNGSLAFTTGPFGKPTHWRSAVILFNKQVALADGAKSLDGQISFQKRPQNPRELQISVTATSSVNPHSQIFLMR
ncbi:S-adenosyl-L-methionine-dependent methyltransferase [Lipomyces japonicus]|uniref:S-adenosyl-L-methionine-dependent methyltransferase n=1 Tax=Lipomyces japonicus TaxID=56871 RepID=UPI0034CE8E78